MLIDTAVATFLCYVAINGHGLRLTIEPIFAKHVRQNQQPTTATMTEITARSVEPGEGGFPTRQACLTNIIRCSLYHGGTLAFSVTRSRSNLSMKRWLVLYCVFRIVFIWYCGKNGYHGRAPPAGKQTARSSKNKIVRIRRSVVPHEVGHASASPLVPLFPTYTFLRARSNPPLST